jgi:hypothetical protein
MLLQRTVSFVKVLNKRELAPPKFNPLSGILYSFTLGMAPWAKESTRRHWILYVRGIFFHVGIFASFFVLAISPWISLLGDWRYLLSFAIGIGFAGGVAGFFIRMSGKEKALSTPDDYASLALITLFQLSALAFSSIDAWSNAFYIITIIMFVYIPFSKICHFLYFFFSRFFFGVKYGMRGVAGFHR